MLLLTITKFGVDIVMIFRRSEINYLALVAFSDCAEYLSGTIVNTAPHHSGSECDMDHTVESNRNVTNRKHKRRAVNTPPEAEITQNMGHYLEEIRSLLNTMSYDCLI